MMGLHTKIFALHDKLSISYKDACHRLYMSAYKKLKMDNRIQKIFLNLKRQATEALGDFQRRLGQLESQVGMLPAAGGDANAFPLTEQH